MKHILVISTHSFVDLITNSSSELYVCDVKKSLQAVKEILVKLLESHDELMGTVHKFENVFKEPYVSKFHFDYYSVSNDVKKNYDYFHKRNFNKSLFWDFGEDENEEYTELQKQEWSVNDEFNKDRWDNKKRNWKRDLTKEEEEELKKQRNSLWTDYGARRYESKCRLFIEFLKQNLFTKKQINKFEKIYKKAILEHRNKNGGQYVFWRLTRDIFKDSKVEEAYDKFSLWEGYGITANKNAIIVESAEDNSIPYELMETVSSYLNANRYHIG